MTTTTANNGSVWTILGGFAVFIYAGFLLLSGYLALGMFFSVPPGMAWYEHFLPHNLSYTFIPYFVLMATSIAGQYREAFSLRLAAQGFVSGVLLLYAALHHTFENIAMVLGAAHLLVTILSIWLNLHFIGKKKAA
ncbi:MAG: hypothetical protein OEV59_09515 [Deltaproteobacteria bacterium]|nr:hypothetical protein [Deltaproteobacteria bacterium]